METEYGGSAHFAKGTAYDSDGNEIVIPKCEFCDVRKCHVIGRESTAWKCLSCDGSGKKIYSDKLVYKPPE